MNSSGSDPSSQPQMPILAQPVQFQAKQAGLESVDVWEYDAATKRTCRAVAEETVRALATPDDFPPIEAAIVPGDRVALAVDPNVPRVAEVVEGAIRMIRSTPAEEIEIVLWDEATKETLDAIEQVAGDYLVVVHQSDSRESLCYLAADVDAEPIYLNRVLVDADFVLPIVAVRPADLGDRRDITGIFPSLSDSASRSRFNDKIERGAASDAAMKSGNTIAEEVPWLLGVQLMLCVSANSNGDAGEVWAGTLEAVAKKITPTLRRPDPVPPPATLVVAALDGDAQQQTWDNVVRAAEAAMLYAQPDATIVVWSTLAESPSGALRSLDAVGLPDIDREAIESMSEKPDKDALPTWDPSVSLASRLQRVLNQHRVMLQSRIDAELIEPVGLGVIQSAAELANLSRGFESCGVLRAAQFAGGNCG